MGGGCSGVNPNSWGACFLAPVEASMSTNATLVASMYQTYDSVDPNAIDMGQFIQHLYKTVFNRSPDLAGYYFWLNLAITNNNTISMSPSQIATDIITSSQDTLYVLAAAAPFQNAQPYVTMLYQALLGRAPDTAGLAFWTGEMTGGTLTADQVLGDLLQSPDDMTYLQKTFNLQ